MPARERGLHELVEKPPQAARADGWKSELGRREGIAVESIQKSWLAARGYPPHFLADAGSGEIATARGLEGLRHAALTLRHGARRAATLAKLYATEPARAQAALRDAVWERLRGRA